MKVSVVVPVFNEEKHIEKCLDSLMNQEKKPDEIIIVNNNSTDRTAEIVKKYKKVTLILEKQQGIIPARNAGFDLASGDIIARCDGDTIVPSNFIKNIEADFAKNKSVVGVSMPITFYDMPIVKRLTSLYYPYMYIPKLILGYYTLVGPGMAVRKSAWKKIRNELCTDPELVHEDVDISLHIVKYGKIFHDKNILVKASGRRAMFNPTSFFGEYTVRFFNMLKTHSF
ncbi:glycosyltransferase [Candidatus Roizmanbacteria bacterium]|nr:glycosyltransferase [Candidatus Roizmanbacteria bacterium]